MYKITAICFAKIKCNSFLSYSTYREAKMLQKFIEDGKASKQKNKISSIVVSKSFPFGHEYEQCTKRMAIINKLYMQHIVEILATGKSSSKINDLGLEVTKVQVNKTLQNVNVYCILKLEKSEMITEILQDIVGELKHDIASYNFLGRLPNVRFVIDTSWQNSLMLEKIFKTIDLESETQQDNISNNFDEDIKHDIFGLSHDKIMRTLMAEIKRKKPINIQSIFESEVNNIKSKEMCQKHTFIPFTKAAFIKFCKKQRSLDKIKK